jgi:hypothetical protein
MILGVRQLCEARAHDATGNFAVPAITGPRSSTGTSTVWKASVRPLRLSRPCRQLEDYGPIRTRHTALPDNGSRRPRQG